VIWQRPLPESLQRQTEHLRWLQDRGCLLFTEWDDHPHLFPTRIKKKLKEINWAPLKICHGLHTSSTTLANALSVHNPIAIVMENYLAFIPKINIEKHQQGKLRVFIGNQNRIMEHNKILEDLTKWLYRNKNIELIIIGDINLAASLPEQRVEYHNLLSYKEYRNLLRSCHIALLPLLQSAPNSCKTPIKLMECLAESVVAICGPELYYRQKHIEHSMVIDSLSEMIPRAEMLSNNTQMRQQIIIKGHEWVKTKMLLQTNIPYRQWLYEAVWQRKQLVDKITNKRIQDINVSIKKF
jgi:hypothetical protein